MKKNKKDLKGCVDALLKAGKEIQDLERKRWAQYIRSTKKDKEE